MLVKGASPSHDHEVLVMCSGGSVGSSIPFWLDGTQINAENLNLLVSNLLRISLPNGGTLGCGSRPGTLPLRSQRHRPFPQPLEHERPKSAKKDPNDNYLLYQKQSLRNKEEERAGEELHDTYTIPSLSRYQESSAPFPSSTAHYTACSQSP